MIFTPYEIDSYKIDDAPTVRYNIRSSASTTAPVIGQCRGGDFITVLVNNYSQEGDYIWQQVKANGIVGYVAISLMRLIPSDVRIESVIMCGSPTNIRSLPDLRGKVVGSVSKNGTFIEIDPTANPNSAGVNWLSVMLEADKVAWVQEDLVKFMPIAPKILDVPHFTQVGNTVHNDCGQASVRMVADYCFGGKKQLPSIDHLAIATNTANKLTSSDDLIKIGMYCGIKLERVSGFNFMDIAHTISADSPLIVLVRYGAFNPQPYHYAGGHWMVITGYDEKGFVCNDPLQIEGSWTPPIDQLDKALQGINLRLIRE